MRANVAKRRVPKIVRQGYGLDQILVQAEVACHRARDLGHLDRVREAGTEQVALVVDEHLRLVFEAPERRRMNDTVSVALVLGASLGRRLGNPPATRASSANAAAR